MLILKTDYHYYYILWLGNIVYSFERSQLYDLIIISEI